MAQDSTPSMVMYIGDGTQTRFEVPFDKGSFGEIKVAFVRRGLTDYTYNPDTYTVDGYLYAWNGGVYTKTEQPTTSTPLYDKTGVATGDNWEEGMYREPKNDIFTQAVVEWTGDTLTTNDVICITRETEADQPYTYQNNQKHIERALDNLSRQIQELGKASQNSLKVDPAWMPIAEGGTNDSDKMDPITWLQTIVRSKGGTLRELRVNEGYIEYTADDPDASSKTWEVVAGVKTGNAGVISHFREYQQTVDNTTVKYLQYSVDGGSTWSTVSSSVAFENISGQPTDNAALDAALGAKQDVISDLSDIRSGAAAGATAVQPADLATVATTGAYSDLTGTPSIPTVNDTTITFTQGGVTKGTITLNQASAETIAFDAGGGGGDLPSQTGHSGEFLTTNGTSASWSAISGLQNTATGTDALTLLGTATTSSYAINVGIGSSSDGVSSVVIGAGASSAAVATNAVAIGMSAGAESGPAGVAVGPYAKCGNSGVAVGSGATARMFHSTAIGTAAVTSMTGSIQIGRGTNNTIGTMSVGLSTNGTDWSNYELLSANGTIPTDRYTTTPSVDGIYVPKLTISSGTATRSWDTLSIPTVNDSTITITQGGVTKGTFTTNQSSASTIALDAGGNLTAGFVAAFAGATAPSGWLICDGSAVSRTDYADLYTAIGTTYGTGDGSTTFNLPDLSDCFVQGGTPGTAHTAGLPNITGTADVLGQSDKAHRGGNYSGALKSVGTANVYNNYDGTSVNDAHGVALDASESSAIYGNSTTVQPKSVEMYWCIKY